MKFLIDECLSPELAKLALDKGHGETSHVVWLKLSGLKDWELKPIILDGDWTFATKNAVDFRGPKDKPGTKGQYADVAIHAGLVCLNGPPGMDLGMQVELFEQALHELDDDSDLINQVLEVTAEDDETLHIVRYALPKVIRKAQRIRPQTLCLRSGCVGFRGELRCRRCWRWVEG